MAKAPKQQVATLQATVSRPELLVDGSDRDFRELVHNMLAFSSLIQSVRNHLGQAIGLSGTQYTVLMAIARLSEYAPEFGINELAEQLHWSGAFVTIEVNKLVKAGLVSKLANASDRRRVILSITAAARGKLKGLNSIQVPANNSLFDGLTEVEFQVLRGIMARLAVSGERTISLLNPS